MLSVWQKWAFLRPHFWTKAAIFFWQSMWTQNGNFTKDYLIVRLTRTKNHLKKSLQLWLSELFLKAVFFKKAYLWLLARNNYPDWQGVWNLPHKFHVYLILLYQKEDKIDFINLVPVKYLSTVFLLYPGGKLGD